MYNRASIAQTPLEPIEKLFETGVGWLVGYFGLNSPLRQYFSLHRAVSQREGEKGEKG